MSTWFSLKGFHRKYDQSNPKLQLKPWDWTQKQWETVFHNISFVRLTQGSWVYIYPDIKHAECWIYPTEWLQEQNLMTDLDSTYFLAALRQYIFNNHFNPEWVGQANEKPSRTVLQKLCHQFAAVIFKMMF